MNPIDVVEMKHSFAGIAEVLAAYRDELLEHGFTRMEALTLCIAWVQAAALAPPKDASE